MASYKNIIYRDLRGYNLQQLVDEVKHGVIALPELQRPFIWKNKRVRDLFDSLYQGYPVGFFLLWDYGVQNKTRKIGTNKKQRKPSFVVVDGQQRLTSFYAVIKGKKIIRDGKEENIEISFNPLEEKFEVANAATQKDPHYLSNITEIWDDDLNSVQEKYIEHLSESQDLTVAEQKKIRQSLSRLQKLSDYPFTPLVIKSDVSKEQASDVFVRINSKGQKLKQTDFILTLISVFWQEGRNKLEKFCQETRQPARAKSSPYNLLVQPYPYELLRVSVWFAFRLGRMQSVYSTLRGEDFKSKKLNSELRNDQFQKLKDAQEHVLNCQYWHDFLKVISFAGYKSQKMISSKNAVLFSYTLYLIGKTELGFAESDLQKIIAKWFFVTALVGYFSGTSEGKLEKILSDLSENKTKEHFCVTLDKVYQQTITNDFWKTNLPSKLATSAGQNPPMFAYFASLAILDANVLFSEQKISEFINPATKEPRSPIERHHLFPSAYLKKHYKIGRKEQNQIANFALVEWGDNAKIGKLPPAEYLPSFKKRFSSEELRKMYYWHALPDNWENMEYEEFLSKRRKMIALVIRDAYKKMFEQSNVNTEQKKVNDIKSLVEVGENTTTEFKSTLSINLHTGEKDEKMHYAALKTIAGFINSPKGGNLLIGIKDDKTPIGIDFENEDKMSLHLNNLIKDRIGKQHAASINHLFSDYKGKRIMQVECQPASSAAYLKDGKEQRFYVRMTAETIELRGVEMQEFIKNRFS